MKRAWFAACLVLVCGCSAITWRHGARVGAPRVTEAEAVAAAKREIRERNGDVPEIRSRTEFRDGIWTVTSQFTAPADVLGLFQEERRCVVVVDGAGGIVTYRPVP